MSTRLGAVVMLAALFGCGSAPVPSEPAVHTSDAAIQPNTEFVAFEDEDIALEHTSRWQQSTFDVIPSTHVNWLVFLSTEPVVNPCHRQGNMTTCTGFPVQGLGPNGAFINWARWGFAGWELDPGVGPLIAIDGRRAVVDRREVSEACRAIGGMEEIVVQIERPVQWNWFEMTACFTGPDVQAVAGEIDAMLASVRWKN